MALYSFLEKIVADYMTREPRIVTRQTSMGELGALFEKEDFNAFPVVDGPQVIGVMSKFDFLSCFVFTTTRMVPRYDELMKRVAGDFMSAEFIYVGPGTKLTRVLELMVDHRVRSMPVMNEDQRLAGIIARGDVIRALEDSINNKTAPATVGCN
jgi:CBS domain-containing protein